MTTAQRSKIGGYIVVREADQEIVGVADTMDEAQELRSHIAATEGQGSYVVIPAELDLVQEPYSWSWLTIKTTIDGQQVELAIIDRS